MKKIFKLCLTILARVLPLWQLSFPMEWRQLIERSEESLF